MRRLSIVNGRPRDEEDVMQWVLTFCLQVIAVVLSGILVGALLRGTGLR